MVLRLGRNKLGQGASLPWESIDPHEGEAATAWEGDSAGQWFLESPPGDWKMEPLPSVQGEPSAMPGKPTGQATDEELTAPPVVSDLVEEEDEDLFPSVPGGGGWTVAVLCVGMSLIAACAIIPQADVNRRLVYEREMLRQDLTQIQSQIAVNHEFLSKLENDPQLTERLAQREMRAVPQGQTALDLKSDGDSPPTASAAAARMSPFSILNVPPPPPLSPYRPVSGKFAELCRTPRSRGFVLGAGMIMVAAGLVLDGRASGDSR
ncbi:MAG: hypothetical protein ABSB33_14170 [Tepidisphaeraceae bacterium]|jgi:hypothetical protein